MEKVAKPRTIEIQTKIKGRSQLELIALGVDKLRDKAPELANLQPTRGKENSSWSNLYDAIMTKFAIDNGVLKLKYRIWRVTKAEVK